MALFPKYIQIETSIVCNGKCVFCPHKDMKRGPKFMEENVWKKIIDETRGKGIVYRPFLINEPFFDIRMPEIIDYIKQDETAKVELNSNGTMSPALNLKELVRSELNEVRFSIDGFTQETYNQSGRNGKLDKIVNNVLSFIEEKNRQKKNTSVEVRMIDLDINKHEQGEFVEFWKKYADKVSITSLYSWPWTGQEEAFMAPCPKVKDEMFFMVDGTAVLCCWDAHAKTIIGNVNENSVEEIWYGELNTKYRSYLDRGQRDKIHICSKCDAFKNYDFSDWKGYH